ncbi:MAG: carbamoyltransferase HypF, partial [Deltaproteobacteria bacterium]
PLQVAVELLKAGHIVAVKGLGGFHLAADAVNDAALEALRARKGRDEKPFALMVGRLQQVQQLAWVDEVEQRLLTGSERPIVLLRRRPQAQLSSLVAPRNRYLGIMLPYTPLHHLLLEPFTALVMTSANFSDEPILYRDDEALERLGTVADAFLLHNRRIYVRADDSIARVMAGKALLIRRARGFVPRPVLLPAELPPVLAVGAELKNTLCLVRRDRAFLSQHIGDLKNAEALASLQQIRDHLQAVLDVQPRAVAHDLHPDYLSTRFAESLDGLPRMAVQHHHAHLVSCLAEHGRSDAAIGVIFDGIGLGDDGTVWGGEFLVGDARDYRRAAHLLPVPMPGGDAATREPWRMAVSWLQTAFGDDWPDIPLVHSLDKGEVRLLQQMMARGLNSPMTSSCGRLFDAVAALCGLRDRVSYEGQAALELEMAIDREEVEHLYAWTLREDESESLQLDVRPLIRGVVDDILVGSGAGEIACRFHLSLAQAVTDVCVRLSSRTGLKTVALSGGVFQNRFLTEALSGLLASRGLEVLRHSLVPPNDGGLALGQAVIAGTRLKNER